MVYTSDQMKQGIYSLKTPLTLQCGLEENDSSIDVILTEFIMSGKIHPNYQDGFILDGQLVNGLENLSLYFNIYKHTNTETAIQRYAIILFPLESDVKPFMLSGTLETLLYLFTFTSEIYKSSMSIALIECISGIKRVYGDVEVYDTPILEIEYIDDHELDIDDPIEDNSDSNIDNTKKSDSKITEDDTPIPTKKNIIDNIQLEETELPSELSNQSKSKDISGDITNINYQVYVTKNALLPFLLTKTIENVTQSEHERYQPCDCDKNNRGICYYQLKSLMDILDLVGDLKELIETNNISFNTI